ncbi:restriction endonuclease subunit S, partial [Methylomonas rivi]
MSKLPDGWCLVEIGQITTDANQTIPEPGEHFRYIDIGSVNRVKKCIETPEILTGENAPSRARKRLRANDVLVSMTRPNLNAVAMVNDDLDNQIASTGFDVLRAVEVDPRWLFNVVRTEAFVEKMSALVQGALYPAIRAKDIRSFPVPLPPLNEQKRIADKLDAVLARVDACRDRLNSIPVILKRFRQSVLSAATSGALT